MFQEAAVFHLPVLKSDLRSILTWLAPLPQAQQCERPFWLMANWLLDPSFREVVKEAWSESRDWSSAVPDFHQKANSWNREQYGNHSIKRGG